MPGGIACSARASSSAKDIGSGSTAQALQVDLELIVAVAHANSRLRSATTSAAARNPPRSELVGIRWISLVPTAAVFAQHGGEFVLASLPTRCAGPSRRHTRPGSNSCSAAGAGGSGRGHQPGPPARTRTTSPDAAGLPASCHAVRPTSNSSFCLATRRGPGDPGQAVGPAAACRNVLGPMVPTRSRAAGPGADPPATPRRSPSRPPTPAS